MANAKSRALQGKKKEDERDEKLEEEAIQIEKNSIALYEKLLAHCDDPEERKIYRHIIADEKHHEVEMKKIKAKEY